MRLERQPRGAAMRVLIGCETSGTVRRAMKARGHYVRSVDLLPSDDDSADHIIGDVRDYLDDDWDLGIFHPTCTRLCNSGVRWLSVPPNGKNLPQMWAELDEGAALFSACWNAPILRVAVENPIMHKHAKARIENYQPPTQTVQPWHFGDPAFKATSLYTRGLPMLLDTNRLTPPKPGTDEHKSWSAIHRAPPSPLRWKIRSKTFQGIAYAMATQWGGYALQKEVANG